MVIGSFLAKCSTVELSTADEKHYTLKNNLLTKAAFRIVGIPHIAFRTRANFVLREISKLDKDAHILDAGCGYGIYTLTLVEKGYTKIQPIDLEQKRVDEVSKLLKEIHPHVHIHPERQSLTNLSFRDNSYDAAICSEVIEHIPNHEDAITELSRVIKPGGKIVLTVPYDSKNNRRIFKMFGHERPGYTRSDLEALFSKHDLYVEKDFYFEYFFGNLLFKFFNFLTSKPLMGILFYPCYLLYTVDRYLKIGEPNCIGVVLRKRS